MKFENTDALATTIRSGSPSRRAKALGHLYASSFKPVETYVLANRGTKSDTKDVFQDGIMVLYRNIVDDKFSGQSSVATYLFSICKNLWLQQLRKQTEYVTKPFDNDAPEVEAGVADAIDSRSLTAVMERLKKECREMLREFYYEKKSMQELAVRFKLGSAQAAKNKKARCLKALSALVKEKKLTFEDFTK